MCAVVLGPSIWSLIRLVMGCCVWFFVVFGRACAFDARVVAVVLFRRDVMVEV